MIVIIILGILSATAIPKFINLQSDAKKAVLDGFVGGFNSADSMVMSKATILGLKYSETVTPVGDTGVDIQYGHMTLTKENIEAAMHISGISLKFNPGSVKQSGSLMAYPGKEKSNLDLLIGKKCWVYITRDKSIPGEIDKAITAITEISITKNYSGC